ncbi:hypothetical protein L6250_02145 [Candidatus Parcubacteria bacterium]|nr:hypothetical protein [Patescibacteria group bacterium]MBU4466683.1 hypothetical protein [Patescibacteria group bacterium]MCG2688417.1 hypothetical protein [Candidatus Parcubacteria bacterium]
MSGLPDVRTVANPDADVDTASVVSIVDADANSASARDTGVTDRDTDANSDSYGHAVTHGNTVADMDAGAADVGGDPQAST